MCVCVCQGVHSNLLQLRGSTILRSYHCCKPCVRLFCPAGGAAQRAIDAISTDAANAPRLLPSEPSARQQDTHCMLVCPTAPHIPAPCMCVCVCVCWDLRRINYHPVFWTPWHQNQEALVCYDHVSNPRYPPGTAAPRSDKQITTALQATWPLQSVKKKNSALAHHYLELPHACTPHNGRSTRPEASSRAAALVPGSGKGEGSQCRDG